MRIITYHGEDIPYSDFVVSTIEESDNQAVIVASNIHDIKPSIYRVSPSIPKDVAEDWIEVMREGYRLDMKYCDFSHFDEEGEPTYVR